MKLNQHHTHSMNLRRSLLGGLGAALLLTSCSAADRALLGDIIDGLHDGHSGGGGHAGGPGGPSPTPCSDSQSADDVYAMIANDLASLDADDALTARYFSLANHANARGCGSALDSDRAALNKLINSLSSDPTLTIPVPVDADLTLYRIDLQDYGWDESVEVSGTSFADHWEALIASSPYAVPFVGADAEDAAVDSGTTVPVLFVDAFVAAASQAPLYYALLGIPDNLDDFLLNELQVDVDAARAANDVVRAGSVGLAPNRPAVELLAERFNIEIRAGSVWQISELGGSAGAMFDDPLGNPAGEREIVFTLPNGLLGHVLADGDGQVKDVAELLLDTNLDDFRARIAHSYLREHAQGVRARDEVRAFALDNPSNFTPDELNRILALYPAAGTLQQILDQDRAAFAQALARIGIDIDDAPEPVSEAFLDFSADVDLATAAGDLFLTSESLEDNLQLLDPDLQALDGGTVARADFSRLYVESLCILSVTLENQPDVAICDAAVNVN